MAMDQERAKHLHFDALVVDTHADTLGPVARGQRRLGEHSAWGHVDLPRLRLGGVNVQFFALYIEPDYKPDRGLLRGLQLADVFYREMARYQQWVEPVFEFDDIESIVSRGKIAVVLSAEGGEIIQGDLGVLRMLYRLGVRCLGLTWNQRNALADGVGELRTGGGLTRLGAAAVSEMNRLGMVVDVSHLNEAGFWDVLNLTKAPLLASHTNARALCDHPRNLWDEQIISLARGGGVIGITFAPNFLRSERRAGLEDVLDHIDHVANLVGTQSIGLGSDFDGIGMTPVGLEDATRLPDLTDGLVRRGYTDEQIRGILGGNHMRLLETVWAGISC